jgi:hypothetical protein
VSVETHPYPISWHPSIQGLHTPTALRTILLRSCLIYEVSVHPELSIPVRFPYYNRTCISQVIHAMYILALHSYTNTLSLKTLSARRSVKIQTLLSKWFPISLYYVIAFSIIYFSCHWHKKVKFSLSTTWRYTEGEEVWLLFFLTSSLDTGEWQNLHLKLYLYLRDRTTVPVQSENGCAPVPLWTSWRRENLSSLIG